MAKALDNYQNLVREIRRGHIEPLYFFYGPEQVLAQYVVTELREKLVPKGLEELNFMKLDGQKTTEAELVQAIQALPMFGSKRLVVIEQPSFVKTKAGAAFEHWEALLDIWPPYTCAVLLAPEVDKRLRTFKDLVRNAASYEFPVLTATEASSWVERQLRRDKIKYPPGTGRFVVSRCGTDLALLRLEVDKLVSFANGCSLSEDDLEALVRNDMETSIFDFVDAIGLQDLGRAWALLNNLIAEGNEPVYLISMIGRQLRLLLAARQALDAGLSQQQAAGHLGIHPFPAGKCVQQARRWTVFQLQAAMEACLQADENIKTGKLRGENALNQLMLILKQRISAAG
ncbi:MAG: DNA polymerase III subunit delta [Firmicutes bacterium]|nr:DNA polymerase III subunit delta [Bacillota bacterium]